MIEVVYGTGKKEDLVAAYKSAIDHLKAKSKTAKGVIEHLEKNGNTLVFVAVNDKTKGASVDNNFYADISKLPPEMLKEMDPDGQIAKKKVFKQVVVWNPGKQFQIKPSKCIQSPTLALAHELGHAKQFNERAPWYNQHATGDKYLVIEEDNLKIHETPIATELGEPTRAKYQDFIGSREFMGADASKPAAERVKLFKK